MQPFTYPLSSATPNSQLTSSSHSTPSCSAFPTNFQYIFLSLKMKIIAIHIQLCCSNSLQYLCPLWFPHISSPLSFPAINHDLLSLSSQQWSNKQTIPTFLSQAPLLSSESLHCTASIQEPPCFSSKLLFALPSDPSLKTSLLPGLLCLFF